MQKEENPHVGTPATRAADGAGDPREAGMPMPPNGPPNGAHRAGRRPRGVRPDRKRTTDGEAPATGTEPAGAADAVTLQAVRKGVIIMLVAAAVLLIFNSAGLRLWARGLSGSAVSDVLVATADRWHGLMQRIGIAAAAATVRDAVADLRGQPWPDPDIMSAGRAETGEGD